MDGLFRAFCRIAGLLPACFSADEHFGEFCDLWQTKAHGGIDDMHAPASQRPLWKDMPQPSIAQGSVHKKIRKHREAYPMQCAAKQRRGGVNRSDGLWHSYRAFRPVRSREAPAMGIRQCGVRQEGVFG